MVERGEGGYIRVCERNVGWRMKVHTKVNHKSHTCRYILIHYNVYYTCI